MTDPQEAWLQRVRYTAAEPNSWLNRARTLGAALNPRIAAETMRRRHGERRSQVGRQSLALSNERR
jgi:hypothetical protein